MIIEFNIEGNPEPAFFALYAGLRMYQEQKDKTTPKNQLNQAAAEAYCMLQDLKKQKPIWFNDAEKEFNEVYK